VKIDASLSLCVCLVMARLSIFEDDESNEKEGRNPCVLDDDLEVVYIGKC